MERTRATKAEMKALQLKPRDPDIFYNLGVVLDAKNDSPGCPYYAMYQRRIIAPNQKSEISRNSNRDVSLYMILAECHQNLNQYESIKTYQEGIKLYPKAADLYFCWLALQDFWSYSGSDRSSDWGIALLPDSFNFEAWKATHAPIFMKQNKKLSFTDADLRFREINSADISRATAETRERFKGVGRYTNFYLQYQGKMI